MKKLSETNQPLEIWGGVECTINRIGDTYYDQLNKNGHDKRLSDLNAIADLGIKKLRYPILWEKVAPNGLKKADWSWTDERINKLKELGIEPIAGLLHHGSGPAYTSLIDPDFPKKFEEFANAVSERYKELQYFTPINEPLTTARFSALYGYWYPHSKDDKLFAKTLIHQCHGTVLAMKAIRKNIPSAKLVQTEDLGKTYSTPQLSYQADFENERRWASIDLLCGKLTDSKPFYHYLVKNAGINPKELEYFLLNQCTPDILGINHYITSERYLDHRLEKFPSWTHGGNGRDQYADVELVRVADHKRAGHYHLLKEAAERFHLPLALTEVHLGCTRDEQLRWFKEAWESSLKLKNEGIDICAITAWSLLGAYDWNSLLVFDHYHYEPGVFDLRGGTPRPTAVAHFIKSLTKGNTNSHPILHSDGWWKRPESVLYKNDFETRVNELREVRNKLDTKRKIEKASPIIITGARGTLGKAFAKICDSRAIPYVLLNRQEMDIANKTSVETTIEKYNPWAVINTAGFVRVDDAESMAEKCLRENSEGPAILAAACNKYGTKFLTFSSDLVFNGNTKSPYKESDHASPLNIYGISKLYAETKVLKNNLNSLIIRTSAFFGPWDNYNFLSQVIGTIQNKTMLIASKDHIVSPTYVPDLVNACLDLLIDGESGIWHISNPSEISWADFAFQTAEMAKLDTKYIKPTSFDKLGYIAERPLYSALGSERGVLLPPLENAIERYLKEMNRNSA